LGKDDGGLDCHDLEGVLKLVDDHRSESFCLEVLSDDHQGLVSLLGEFHKSYYLTGTLDDIIDDYHIHSVVIGKLLFLSGPLLASLNTLSEVGREKS